MASAIPVPGQPGRLWIPGIGVVDQSREGNMKISNYEGEAAAAAAAQDSLGQFRVALRPEFAARAAAIEARGELLQRATPAAMGPIAAQMLARQQQAQANAEAAVAQQEQDAGFDWTNPWFLGGVAAVTLGGVWFWMRRR